MTLQIAEPTDAVSQVFEAYPSALQRRLLQIRELIFKVAAEQNVGPLEETLKWGQASYLTTGPKCGTTIRLDRTKGDDTRWALFVHCQTDLVERYRAHYADQFDFEGNRALTGSTTGKLPTKELAHCIAMALTYHRTERVT